MCEQGELLLGDTLLAVNDVTIQHHDNLLATLHSHVAGDVVSIKLVRGGVVQTLSVTLSER